MNVKTIKKNEGEGSLAESAVLTGMMPMPRMGQDTPETVPRSSRSVRSVKSEATEEKCRPAPVSTTHDRELSRLREEIKTGKAA